MKITLAIVTKDRTKKLSRCLKSISNQEVSPDQLVIIDNDPNASAKKIVDRNKSLPQTKYYLCTDQGVPKARNMALKLCKTEILAFVDDDCVLDKNWIKQCFVGFKNKKTDFVVGKTKLYNNKNLIALATHVRHDYWFKYNLERNNRPHPFNLDTKNIAIKTHKINKIKIKFDSKISIGWYDSADTDFGFQLESNNMFGSYNKNMIVSHEEGEKALLYLKKAYYRGKLAAILTKKWEIKNEYISSTTLNPKTILHRIKNIPSEYQGYTKKQKIKKTAKIKTYLLIKAFDTFFKFGYLS
ncbi:glycosyltransferase family 2 protein [Patescibacteria group bacterium]